MDIKEFDELLKAYDDASESRVLIWGSEFSRREGINAVRKKRDDYADTLREKIIDAFKQAITVKEG